MLLAVAEDDELVCDWGLEGTEREEGWSRGSYD